MKTIFLPFNNFIFSSSIEKPLMELETGIFYFWAGNW